MASDMWSCESCRSLNLPTAVRCYSCHLARGASPASLSEGDENRASGVIQAGQVGLWARTAVLLGAMAIAGAALAVFVVTAGSPAAPAGEVAAATFAPPSPTPTLAPPIVRAPPVPVPTPTPAFIAYTGRFSGTWLLGQELGSEATSAGAYPRELLLQVRPRCGEGPCSVTASLVDPRSGKTLSSKRVKRTDGKYRFAIKAAITDLCRGNDGRTVEGGAKRNTEFQLQPFVDSKTGEMVLAATGSLRLNPNRRGDSVGCRDAKSEVSVTAEKLTKETRATVKQRLSPIPQPDLVPRPDFTVSVKGVRMVYYPVKGTSARQLQDRWAATSSKKKYCGTSQYSWNKGSRTLSCIKSSWDPDIDIHRRPVQRQLHGYGRPTQSANVDADRSLDGTLACAT